jgi:hypothetical protein
VILPAHEVRLKGVRLKADTTYIAL